jgi:acetyl esterase/lipase
LHIDLHGGGFIGGLIEQDARWCQHLVEETGAVVVSCEYRIAPRHTFPAAHDDIDEMVSWILENAEAKLNADANLLTMGGSSAGGNLALSAAIELHRRREANGSGPVVKAMLGFCPLVDLRPKPEEKPRPPNFPTKDPLFWMLPMYDTYPGPSRAQDLANPRINPIIADKETLPEHILFIVAGIDILLHEQLTFIERVRGELEREHNTKRRVEAKLIEKGFHGWLECKSPRQVTYWVELD